MSNLFIVRDHTLGIRTVHEGDATAAFRDLFTFWLKFGHTAELIEIDTQMNDIVGHVVREAA